MIDWPQDLGLKRFTAEQSEQARSTPQFDQLDTEIAKLVSLQGGAIDWKKIESDAIAYLTNQANDLAVAIWLVQAATILYQAQGLQCGLEVLVRLHQQQWQTMAPPVKRLRARRNQMQWLLEQLSRHVQQSEIEFTKKQYESVVASWQVLMQLWHEHDDEAPALSSFLNLLVMSDDSGEESEVNSVDMTESGEEAVVSNEVAVPAIPEPIVPEPVLAGPSRDLDLKPSLVPAVELEVAPQVVATEKIETSTQLEQRLDSLFEVVLDEIGQPTNELLQDALFYRFNRSMAWLTLSSMPYSQQGITRLSAPPQAIRERLEALQQQTPLDLLRYIESLVVQQRYWLDLQHQAYLAALGLQPSGEIAAAIGEETALLVRRFPGIESLFFIDETPFASEETKSWLSSFLPSTVRTSEVQTETGTQGTNASINAMSWPQSDVSMVALLASAQAQAKLAAQSLSVLEEQLTQNLNRFLSK